jgi:RecB family exonuclease
VLAEERRLFYVAVTRSRRRLVVSAVDAAADDGLRPSPFLDDLVEPRDSGPSDVRTEPLPDVHRRDPGLAPRSLSVAPLVAELRATLLDPSASPALPDHAAAHLAAFAEAGVRAADPDHWWGLRPLTVAAPVRLPDEPLRLSGTSLATLADCPLRWFLEHEAGAGRARSVAMGFGSVVHALADELGRGLVTADVDALDARLSAVWDHLGFEAPWHSERERESARAALVRLLQWLDEPRGRDLVDTEVRFDHQLQFSGDAGPVTLQLRGFIDRLEVDQSGRVWVVDFKTGRSKPTNTSVAQHVQLGLYQYAICEGALSAPPLGDSPNVTAGTKVGGAELVQLRHDAARGAAGPYVQQQPALQTDASGRTFVDELLADAVDVISQERYFPRPSDDCPRCPVRMACPAQPAGRQVLQ